jgi:hypothetical protein
MREVGEGKYDILVGGARVAPWERDQNRIHAFIHDEAPPKQWTIMPVHPGAREFLYVPLDRRATLLSLAIGLFLLMTVHQHHYGWQSSLVSPGRGTTLSG